MKPKISVIIPVYNVNKFVGKCTMSLMKQSLRDIEYIFVDDATPDNSIKIIKDIICQFPQRDIKFFTHETNKGLPEARNTGIMQAKGEYIYHCDSDDWLESNMLEELYYAAVKFDADISYCDFYLSYENFDRYMKTIDFHNGEDMTRQGFLSGRMKYNVWNKLVRRRLYEDNNILFPSGHSMGEDMTMILLCANAKSVIRVPLGLYHYNQMNNNSFSKEWSSHQTDIKYNVAKVNDYLTNKYQDIENELHLFKLSIKLPLLISDKKSDYVYWRDVFSEANAYIPRDSFSPKRIKFIEWCAWKRIYFPIRVYNYLLAMRNSTFAGK